MPLEESIAGSSGGRAVNPFEALTTLEGLTRQPLLSQAGRETFLTIMPPDYKSLAAL